MRQIIVCLSDPQLSILLRHVLATEGFRAACAYPSEKGFLTSSLKSSAIIGEFPDRTGHLVRLRNIETISEIPLIVLSRGPEVIGSEFSAALVLRRPFDPDELLGFIRGLGQSKYQSGSATVIRFEDIELDPSAHRTRRRGQIVELTALQFRLLSHLIGRPETVCGREELISACWPADAVVEPRTVDIHIGEIRRRLSLMGPDPIRTVRGAGYALSACPAEQSLQD